MKLKDAEDKSDSNLFFLGEGFSHPRSFRYRVCCPVLLLGFYGNISRGHLVSGLKRSNLCFPLDFFIRFRQKKNPFWAEARNRDTLHRTLLKEYIPTEWTSRNLSLSNIFFADKTCTCEAASMKREKGNLLEKLNHLLACHTWVVSRPTWPFRAYGLNR